MQNFDELLEAITSEVTAAMTCKPLLQFLFFLFFPHLHFQFAKISKVMEAHPMNDMLSDVSVVRMRQNVERKKKHEMLHHLVLLNAGMAFKCCEKELQHYRAGKALLSLFFSAMSCRPDTEKKRCILTQEMLEKPLVNRQINAGKSKKIA